MSELKTVTLQEENTGISLHDCGSDNDLSEVTARVHVTTEKKKKRHAGLHQQERSLCFKGHHQGSEDRTHGNGENFHKDLMASH